MITTRVSFVSGVALLAIALVGCESSGPGTSPGTGGSGNPTGSGGSATGSGGSSTGSGGSGSGGSTQGSGGSDGSGGSATGSGGSTGGSGGSGSGGTTGSGGASGTDGGTGGAGVDAGRTDTGGAVVEPGDTPPHRALAVTAAKARQSHTFMARAADPAVAFNDNTQVAAVDPRAAKMVGKLVLTFMGAGARAGGFGAAGEFVIRRGYHVIGIAAFQDYDILRNDADFYGDARKTVFEGVSYTKKFEFATINWVPSDGVAKRTEMALKYLHRMYPTEDWGYYLKEDGTVRWSDVIFTGQSHGASNSARFAMLVRAARAVSFSGPRENTCLAYPGCGTPLYAKWFDETAATPKDRFYALTGTADEQHPQHLFAFQKIGYPGTPVNTSVGGTFNNSHRLVAQGAGHDVNCNEGAFRGVCNYLFGVPPENANGTP